MATYQYPAYPYHPPAFADGLAPTAQVVIVGGGQVGLTMALDLAQRGVASVVLDEDNTVSDGSRAICQAKRTLEIWDRLGVAAPMMAKGVTWNEGHVFYRGERLYAFNMQENPHSKFPAFINIQQYYVEQFLVEQAMQQPLIELRWCHRVTGLETAPAGVCLTVETPDGIYTQPCDWLVAADGVRSTIRRQMGLSFSGQVFEDHFLIADIIMQREGPAIRRFYFDPPWGPEASALMHRQSDNVWRLDFQLGWNVDRDEELRDENVFARIRRMIGPDTPFELEWKSLYTFQCRSIERYRHDRVLFIGDAAHQVSPFGARGGNGGVQDADNLGWKLALVVQGRAGQALLDSYDDERRFAAAENILNSTRATDFITPKTPVSEVYRNAVLDLARDFPFARTLVNSGRLSVPAHLTESSLNGADELRGSVRPGSPVPALPLSVPDNATASHLTDILGDGFTLLCFGPANAELHVDSPLGLRLLHAGQDFRDSDGSIAAAFGVRDNAVVLVRPDQHVMACWRTPDPATILGALAKIRGDG